MALAISPNQTYHSFQACPSDEMADVLADRFACGQPTPKPSVAQRIGYIVKVTFYHTYKLLDAFLFDQASNRLRMLNRDNKQVKRLQQELVVVQGNNTLEAQEKAGEIRTRLGRIDKGSKLYAASLWLRVVEATLFLIGTGLAFAKAHFTKIAEVALKAIGITASCCSLIFMGTLFAIARGIELWHDVKAYKISIELRDQLRAQIKMFGPVHPNDQTPALKMLKLRLEAMEDITLLSQRFDLAQKVFDIVITTSGYIAAGVALAMGANVAPILLVVALAIVVMSVVFTIVHNSIWAANVCKHKEKAIKVLKGCKQEDLPEHIREDLPQHIREQVAKDLRVLDHDGNVCAARVNNLDVVLWLNGEVFAAV